MPLKTIHKLSNISIARIYGLLSELRLEGLVSKIKKGHHMYISLEKDALIKFFANSSKHHVTEEVIARLLQIGAVTK